MVDRIAGPLLLGATMTHAATAANAHVIENHLYREEMVYVVRGP